MKQLFSVRTIILAGSLLLQLSTLCFQSRGVAGDGDLSFDPGSGVNGALHALALQPDGKVLLGGDFITVNGVVRPHVARLDGDSVVVPSLNIVRSNALVIVAWPLSATSFVLDQSLTTTGISISVPATTGNKFYRLRKL